MKYTYTQKREWYSSAQKSVVMAPRGLVASSQQLATLSGYKALSNGGNAIDAAVAMVATLSVVEPHSVGIGGDSFALIYLFNENKLVGMNGSGRAPSKACISRFNKMGINCLPERGILTVTVPGALHSWAQAIKRYGKLTIDALFEDAIYYAENGFPVTEVIAGEWKNMEETLLSQESSANTFLINKKAPRPGQIFQNKDLAKTYRKIVSEGIEAFYEGEICDAIIKFSQQNNGFLCPEDFKAHRTTWVEPISTDYRGYTIYELPPNGQGITALQMLNILEGYDIASMPHNGEEYLHLLIEAKKIAFRDRDKFITDPDFEDIPIEKLISKEYAKKCRKLIDVNNANTDLNTVSSTNDSDTVYVTAVDEERNVVSFISSIFMPFGSGMVVDRTGIVLQNRGKSFSLNPSHPNHLEPHKRPMHTLIPGMVFQGEDFLMSFGVMGGDMQPQGHVQFLINLIDFQMNLQEALDVQRIRHMQGMAVYLEDGISKETAYALQQKGHRILYAPASVNQVGGGQAVCIDEKGRVLLGASDRRKDGCAIGY